MNNQQPEKVFVEGMLVKPGPGGDIPWVKAKVSIKLDEFGAWIAAQKKADPSIEWINIDINESRGGKWYAERNMWKKPDDEQPKQAPIPNDDIPW